MDKSNSHNIYFVTFFCAIRKTILLKLTEQNKQKIQYLQELAGDVVGALSLFLMLAIGLIFAGIYG